MTTEKTSAEEVSRVVFRALHASVRVPLSKNKQHKLTQLSEHIADAYINMFVEEFRRNPTVQDDVMLSVLLRHIRIGGEPTYMEELDMLRYFRMIYAVVHGAAMHGYDCDGRESHPDCA